MLRRLLPLTDASIDERMTIEPDVSANARTVLANVFGYSDFRNSQAETIAHLEHGGSALPVMPTGGGKSLCYQIPAITRPGTGLVISPLIALMQDQVDALEQAGVPAAFLNSSQSWAEQNEVLARLRAGALDLLYVAPERAVTARFLGVADQTEWSLLAIDEAHCISQWGHEFRPEYRELSVLRERWSDVPCLAATATADAPTRRDVAAQLGLDSSDVFVTGFDRPNLEYGVTPKIDARRQLTTWLTTRHRGDAGIVYCGTRKKCEQVADWLRQEGVDAHAYHAGMESADRAAVQRRFLREDGVVVVATIAFGMGIDKPDVRFVVHLDVPRSLEAYYQESGRAGRDGAPSDCWMLFGWQDVVRASQMIGSVADDAGTPVQHRLTERRKLEQLVGWAESPDCRRSGLLRYFDDATTDVSPRERCCDNCQSPPETRDATEAAQKLLSCVRRVGESFGVVHVIDVLLGRSTEKVERFGHDRLSTFGIGPENDSHGWRSVARQLVAAGLLRVDVDGKGVLELTHSSWEVLRGERRVELKVEHTTPGAARKTRRTSKPAAAVELEGTDHELFEHLRALRQRIAHEQDVPAYVIFHDRTLAEMARHRPADLDELGTLHGVGAKKLERYGDQFLRALGGES